MSQVPAVAVVAAAAVQVNAWSPAWLPALWRVALQTVQVPPAAVHAHLYILVVSTCSGSENE